MIMGTSQGCGWEQEDSMIGEWSTSEKFAISAHPARRTRMEGQDLDPS